MTLSIAGLRKVLATSFAPAGAPGLEHADSTCCRSLHSRHRCAERDNTRHTHAQLCMPSDLSCVCQTGCCALIWWRQTGKVLSSVSSSEAHQPLSCNDIRCFFTRNYYCSFFTSTYLSWSIMSNGIRAFTRIPYTSFTALAPLASRSLVCSPFPYCFMLAPPSVSAAPCSPVEPCIPVFSSNGTRRGGEAGIRENVAAAMSSENAALLEDFTRSRMS